MTIQLLCDNPNSWMVPYAQKIVSRLQEKNHTVTLLHNAEEVTGGDVLILLSCEKIFKALHLNKHNLVVHESALPQGKGWSPLTWQVLEGKNSIPVTLFEASENVDAGDVYDQYTIELNGTELVDELRAKQFEATQELIERFVESYPNIHGVPQEGAESFYPRRKPAHSEIDVNATLQSQFNLLRVCDNERYPAYFLMNGVKYLLKIEKAT